jgi:aspartate racemase
VEQVAQAGADFYVCPDNTAHIVLEQIAEKLPIPGLHIADVVCDEIVANHWTEVALLGTRWTMDGPVYANALQRRHLEKLIPPQGVRKQINAAIFEELCQGIFSTQTTRMFSRAIDDLGTRGAECVILGCTEIPLIIDSSNASLPVLDSTRLLAEHAVDVALDAHELQSHGGWILGNTH